MNQLESNLNDTLENPDEIWMDKKTIEGKPLHIYMGTWQEEPIPVCWNR